MPNFDAFERLLRQGMTEPARTAGIAREMAAIYDANRPTFARERSYAELRDWLTRAQQALSAMFPPGEVFSTSDDNRAGKDLRALNSSVDIELKSPGGRTDANVGVKSIAWALDDDSERLSEIMSGRMKERREIWKSTKDVTDRNLGLARSKHAQMLELVDYFTSRLTPGLPVVPRFGHYVRSLAVGITKLSEIRSTLEGSAAKLPLLLVADWDAGLQSYEQSFASDEAIVVDGISASEDTSRVSVKVRGEVTGRVCEIYPHYKNSYRGQGLEIPAAAWVNTACFHIWFE